MMASNSHTTMPLSLRIGTRPARECSLIRVLVSGVDSGTISSVKSIPETRMASHGRKDQEE